MSGLHELAEAVGLQVHWEDATGKPQTVSDASLIRVLGALGYPAESETEWHESAARHARETRASAFVSADSGLPVLLPEGFEAAIATVELESGEMITREVGDDRLLAPIGPTGYHRLRSGECEITLAIAPPRCFGIDDIEAGARVWGPAVQVPSLRGSEPSPFGDFASLAEAARAFAVRGADVMAISPVHALFPADPSRYSPYGPSSRGFLNILFACPPRHGTGDGGDLIDWHGAIPERVAALRAAYQARDSETQEAFCQWRAGQGEDLERQAIFDALHAHFFERGAGGWQGWPEEYRDPRSEAVRAFAEASREDVSFYAFAQWQAARRLDAAQSAALECGMAVGLIADLAVGIDSGGAQAWSRREELLHGLSIGAPPDLLGPQGQDWGLTSFSPRGLHRSGFAGFIAMVRTALRHAGGLRIDHVLGLNRLWVIPHGTHSAEGAYLRYPLDDLLRILAIESHRARALIIGEDLGTVPPDLRPKLRAWGLSGMRVLWFERDGSGNYIPPGEWEKSAVAMTGTHDTHTVAGWWTGRDIDWNRKLGRGGADRDEAEERAERESERDRLWQALTRFGAASGPRPDAQTPGAVVDAAIRHVATTPCEIAIIPLEDLVGLTEQPNLPGTMSEHPNWRRRMPGPTEELLDQPEVSARIAALNVVRA